MRTLDDIYGSNLLKAPDLKGQDMPLVIAGWSMSEFPDQERPKVILTFQGTDKELVLNKTNANRVAESHGDVPDAWVGKEITLYPDRVEFGGKIVDAIRVRYPAIQTGDPSVPPPDDAGFV